MGSRKLTDEQVIEIHRSRARMDVLAERYGVSRWSILRIKQGKHYKHLNLGQTKTIRERVTERLLGLPHRRPVEPSITAHEIFVEEGWILECHCDLCTTKSSSKKTKPRRYQPGGFTFPNSDRPSSERE